MTNEHLRPVLDEEDFEVHYDLTTDSWITKDGAPVCQDHATREPCPYTHSRARLRGMLNG